MKNKKIHNIKLPTVQQLIDQVGRELLRKEKQKFSWKDFYSKFDKELAIEVKRGAWRQWR
jgi:hypothetical protein